MFKDHFKFAKGISTEVYLSSRGATLDDHNLAPKSVNDFAFRRYELNEFTPNAVLRLVR